MMASRVDRKGFEFRKILSSVSDGLGRDDVRGLKNLCYDDISERRREEIDSGLGVFNVLIEKKRIGADFPEFLVELLQEVGRMDLADKVKDYIAKLEKSDFQPQQVTDSLEQSQLRRIAADVGKDWKMLGRHLGLDEAVITTIQHQSYGDLVEASLQALLRWQKEKGSAATPRVLKAALTEMNLMGIVHTHFQ